MLRLILLYVMHQLGPLSKVLNLIMAIMVVTNVHNVVGD